MSEYGKNKYSSVLRSARASSEGYYTKSIGETFTQTKEGKAHDSMLPKNVKLRESRDSEVNPLTLGIQFYLDLTGSMMDIPATMIKHGLPTLMSTLTQHGIEDAVLMFGGVGDHEVDKYPLQIGQFESGDAELDMWLTRTYLERGGGSNAGESYLLAWYFAAYHTACDNWDKRRQKGFVFTVGDEPCLENISMSAIKEIMGDTAVIDQGTKYTMAGLLAAAQEKNNVYHIFLEHGRRTCNIEWNNLMGQNLIIAKDHSEIPKIIADTVYANYKPVLKKDGEAERTEIQEGKEPVKTKITL